MKGLLIGFFQLLCLVQVFGASQLDTHPQDQAGISFLIHHLHPTEHAHFVVKHHKSSSTIGSDTSFPAEDTELVFETIEEETEDFSSHKHLYSNLYFAGIPVDQSLDYLYGSGNSSAFYEQLPFVTSGKRHVVFQVFRI